MREKISVLIITRNRPNDLKALLNSIRNQSVKPFEVIVVDNGSGKETESLCKKYIKVLPIVYVQEEKIGIPYARNCSIRNARGNIFAFTDDDCIWPKDRLKKINTLFTGDRNLDAAIGYTKPLKKYPISLVEQYYYERWLLNFVSDFNNDQRVTNGKIFDFKNTIVRKRVFKKMKSLFSEKLFDCNKEDIEFGTRLIKKCKKVLFIPELLLLHKNSENTVKLFKRNVRYGGATYLLKKRLGIVVDDANSFLTQAELAWRISKDLNSLFEKMVFLILLVLYPPFSKFGYLSKRFSK